MPITLTCQNCNKTQEPWLDKQSNKVFCSECDKELQANHFLKIQLQTLKQYKQKTSAFLIKCVKCGKESTPQKSNNDIVCGICTKPLDHLTPIFKKMLFERLDKLKEDV